MAELINLDDTTNCPLGRRCVGCGTEDDLAVGTAVTPVGVHCVTLCDPCADRGTLPNLACSTAAMSVLEHCSHLDCDVDDMAAAMQAEAVTG